MDSEHIIQCCQIKNKDEIRYQIYQQLIKTSTQNNNIKKKFSQPNYKNQFKKIQDNNLTINKVDKGNIITLDNKNIIDQKH